MRFDNLNIKYLDEAVKLAQTQYVNECKDSPSLYNKAYASELKIMLKNIFEMGFGKVAIEGERLIGYMSFWGPFENQFGNVKGSFSPMYANAYGGEDRAKIASYLFENVSKDMVSKGVLSYALSIYANDHEILNSLSLNGFGYRCADAIRNIEDPLDIEMNTNFSYCELSIGEAEKLLDLSNKLKKHMRSSPTYFPVPEETFEEFVKSRNDNKSRFFVAKDENKIIGYYEVVSSGETFITEEEDYRHLVGAYIDEEYRGMNILQSLLNVLIEKLKNEGVKKLGVDCETINPAAFRYWKKYFDIYTYSLVRRLDERITKL